MMNLRRYEFKLSPSAGQLESLERHRRMHCDLYNALLQMRIERWRGECQRRAKPDRKGLSYFDQSKDLTGLRRELPEWAALSSSSMAATAQRLDRAYQAFMRRAKQGMGYQSGFPRFQSGRRYTGFSFKKPGSGWNLKLRQDGRAGSIYMKDIPGRVKFRGRFPAKPKEIRTCDLLWRDERWWLSIVVDMPVRREAGQGRAKIEFDLIDSFARLSRENNGGCAAGPEDMTEFFMSDGRITSDFQQVAAGERVDDAGRPVVRESSEAGVTAGETVATPLGVKVRESSETGVTAGSLHGAIPAVKVRESSETGVTAGDGQRGLLATGVREPHENNIEALQARRAKLKRGSNLYRKLSRQIAKRQSKEKRRRREALHRWTTEVATSCENLTIVAPESIKDITESGKGDEYEHGAAVKTKAKVNKAILGQAPALAIQMLQYKMEEGGGSAEVIKDKNHKTKVGADVVKTAKSVRRAKRASKRKDDD